MDIQPHIRYRAKWEDVGNNGFRRFNGGELKIRRMELPDYQGHIYLFEDEVEVASGSGSTLSVTRPYYVHVPVPRARGVEVPTNEPAVPR